MGHGIAQISAMSGYEVLAIETNDAALNVGIARCSPLFFWYSSLPFYLFFLCRSCACMLLWSYFYSVDFSSLFSFPGGFHHLSYVFTSTPLFSPHHVTPHIHHSPTSLLLMSSFPSTISSIFATISESRILLARHSQKKLRKENWLRWNKKQCKKMN